VLNKKLAMFCHPTGIKSMAVHGSLLMVIMGLLLTKL